MADKIAKIVDDLGAVKARLAACKREEQKLIQKLKDKGCRTYEGVLFEACVFEQGRTLIDWEAIVKELVGFVPPKVLRKHTTKDTITVCKVTARKSK